ncbi:MAG: NAD-glutamate dehydrogenase [Alphaproteobacteria bacterium]|nr:NAD-glutamate dehydrogenase [Alphaproteobacteria bacterium]
MAEVIDGKTRKLAARITRIVKRGRKGARARLAEDFVRAYYARAPHDDVANLSDADLAGQAMAMLDFGRTRKPGRALIRVYNPSRKDHGWDSDHTAIEIVNDDMPFLVDSVTGALNSRGYGVRLLIHPVIAVKRGAKGVITRIAPPGADPARESFIHVGLDRQATTWEMAALKRALTPVLHDVRVAVRDWRSMRARLGEIISEFPGHLPGISDEALQEVRAFLRWIDDDHFTFLGYRRYDLRNNVTAADAIVGGSGLGILADPKARVFQTDDERLSAKVRRALAKSGLVTISKGNRRSNVHRAVHMDTIGIKTLDRRGRVTGEHRFVGLFTSHAYSLSPRFIPILRRKIDRVMTNAGFDRTSHDGKALLHILETYPRDELFQISAQDLMETGVGILHLQERQRTALFVRHDPLERYISCLVFTPKAGFESSLRERFEEILCRAMDGTISAYYTHIGDEPLARVHFIVKTQPGNVRAYDREAVERDLAVAARSWSEDLHDILVAAHGEREGVVLFTRYQRAFSAAYREKFSASQAVHDIEMAEQALAGGEVALNLYRRQGGAADELRLKIYHSRDPLPLSDVLPMLENMGLRVIEEIPFEVVPVGAGTVWIHDFGMQRRVSPEGGKGPEFAELKEKFEQAFARLWRGEIEDDGYNQLVLTEAMGWREVVLVRAYSKYLRQARAPFSQDYMIETFASNPGFARLLVDLFATRFDPADRDKAETRAVTLKVEYEEALDSVESLDEDRILRRFLNLVLATLRTNYYQKTEAGGLKPYVSFKLDSEAIDELPLPRPWREIFVYSPRMEGIHLRGGPIARGGIRWSDRREDFRTEILDLMKAQTVKNPVIVPVGAKGGFVVKHPPTEGGREAFIAEGIACYKTLIGGLLDITDNRDGDRVIAPQGVVREDGDDPYLVVAADKGTATFSDIANGIAREYGFWLDDAFASGGSVGYDHKKMGITARGAWESVKRHFRELGRDIQRHDFTVVGVGDMAGDVFGNGMLLSRHIKLLAAFNHMHIFIDPDPDPGKSLAERRRLFRKPRSTWTDYDKGLISKGGGIFQRSAKSVPLSPQMKALLETNQSAIAPDDLIKRLLGADVDLLWFGGIGTFVKSSAESHLDAGDRANDPTRVDGRDLRCKVLGEGANLGITQLGRIEYARAGGRLNTDSVDNSAGVDCSDHEVNIKILLGQVVADKRLTMAKRDKLLAAMTDEVAELVLRDNYLQTGALTVAEAEAADRLPNVARLIRALERATRVNRSIDVLPDEEGLARLGNSGLGLTRPETSVLLAHAKLALYDELLESDLPDDPLLVNDLVAYFPTPVRKTYAKAIANHRLRRELISTSITNQVVNRAGFTFVNDLKERGDRPAPAVARAFTIVRDAFGCEALWRDIEALDNKLDVEVQTAALIDIKALIERASLWFLQNGSHPLDITHNVALFQPCIEALGRCLADVGSANDLAFVEARRRDFEDKGMPARLAGGIARLPLMGAALDIVRVAGGDATAVTDAARVYFGIGARFGFDWLRDAARAIEAQTPWQRQAVQSMVDELYGLQFDLVTHVMDAAGGITAAEVVVDIWTDAHKAAVDRVEQMLADMGTSGTPDIAMIAVAVRRLRLLVGS